MLKQALTGNIGTSTGIVPLGSLTPLYTSTITVVSNKFVIPSGGDGYYLFNITGYTNDATMTTISTLKNNVAFTASSSGITGAWANVSGMVYLAAGDTLHFSSVGTYGVNNGTGVFIGRLFNSVTSPYPTCNAAFRVATTSNTVSSPTVYPMGANTKTVYGTTADLPTTSTVQHNGADEVSILSLSHYITGAATNKGYQLLNCAYGGRSTCFTGFTSAIYAEQLELMVVCNQTNQLQTLGIFSTPDSATIYAGTSLGFIKYT